MHCGYSSTPEKKLTTKLCRPKKTLCGESSLVNLTSCYIKKVNKVSMETWKEDRMTDVLY